MMISTLLHGWVQRAFVVLFTLTAIGVRVSLHDEARLHLLYSLVAFLSFFVFLMVATRLPLLTHSSMAMLLPSYQQKLKHSLIVVWIAALLPVLLVLPDIALGLGFASVLILMAIVFVAMIYKPIFQVFFWILFFAPLGFDFFAPDLSGRSVMIACAWALPLVLVFADFCLNKLVQYRGNTKHVNRLISLMNVSMEKTLAVQESVPLHQRTRLSQWWSNTHFDHYRKLLNQHYDKKTQQSKLSNNQLIAICCQGVNSFGLNAYLLWASAIGTLCLVGLTIDESYHHYFTVLMTAIPIMIIGTGTIAVFQIIQNKKSYLARVASMPRFTTPNSFTHGFISYVLLNQATLYIFISLLVGAMALVFHHINLTTYINLLLVLVLYCLVNLSMMFLGWAAKQDHSNKIVWLMIIGLISLLVFAILLKENENIELASSMVFIFICSLIISLLGYSINRYNNLSSG
jgi:hypothetical protein